jgi:hypothetical protein
MPYDASEDAPCYCGAEVAWENMVDETNGESHGVIPIESLQKHFLMTPEKQETCNLGHQHLVVRAIYRVPTKAETKPLRLWFDPYLEKLIPIESYGRHNEQD